jgi:hypothetical protein
LETPSGAFVFKISPKLAKFPKGFLEQKRKSLGSITKVMKCKHFVFVPKTVPSLNYLVNLTKWFLEQKQNPLGILRK